jgi:hypothetical protein
VVDRKAKEAKQATQGVRTHAVDIVPLAAYRQLAVVAEGALTPWLEDGDDGAVKVRSGAAIVAAK